MESNNAKDYFEIIDDIGECLQCKRRISAKGGSTSGMLSHLKTQHKIDLLKRKAESAETAKQRAPSKKVITEFFQPSPLPSPNVQLPPTVARMVALDGLAFRLFCSSEDLRLLLSNKFNRPIPTSPNTIKAMVMKYGEQVKQEITSTIAEVKKTQRFSTTFDEWTSQRNRRFMNINIHYGDNKHINLGLVRVVGSLPAERCVEELTSHLAKFGLNIETDIVCNTTDGASVMRKVGKLVPSFHILCMLHGIQLAVVDVLYKRKSQNNPQPEEESNDDNDDDEDDDEDGVQVNNNFTIYCNDSNLLYYFIFSDTQPMQ